MAVKAIAVGFRDFLKLVHNFKLKTFGLDAMNVEQLKIWLKPLGSQVGIISPRVGDDTLTLISFKITVTKLLV